MYKNVTSLSLIQKAESLQRNFSEKSKEINRRFLQKYKEIYPFTHSDTLISASLNRFSVQQAKGDGQLSNPPLYWRF